MVIAVEICLDVYLKNVRVPAENILGPQGQGFTVLRAAISFGKIAICSCILGEMQAALELSINYAREKAHRKEHWQIPHGTTGNS